MIDEVRIKIKVLMAPPAHSCCCSYLLFCSTPHPFIHLMLELLLLLHTIPLQCCLFTHPLMILFTLNILLSQLLSLSTPLLLHSFSAGHSLHPTSPAFNHHPAVDASASSASLQLPTSELHSSVHLLPYPPSPSC